MYEINKGPGNRLHELNTLATRNISAGAGGGREIKKPQKRFISLPQ
jgi:hypothetical protein